MTPTEAVLHARVEQLESDREMLFDTFRAVDGEFHEAIARHRSDRALIAALRATQIEHGHLLAALVTGQGKLELKQERLADGQARLEGRMGDLERLIRRGFDLPEQE